MDAQTLTPIIEVAIGRELRLYHAYVTTAPAKLDAPATLRCMPRPSGMCRAWPQRPSCSIRCARRHRRDSSSLTLWNSPGSVPVIAETNTYCFPRIACS